MKIANLSWTKRVFLQLNFYSLRLIAIMTTTLLISCNYQTHEKEELNANGTIQNSTVYYTRSTLTCCVHKTCENTHHWTFSIVIINLSARQADTHKHIALTLSWWKVTNVPTGILCLCRCGLSYFWWHEMYVEWQSTH